MTEQWEVWLDEERQMNEADIEHPDAVVQADGFQSAALVASLALYRRFQSDPQGLLVSRDRQTFYIVTIRMAPVFGATERMLTRAQLMGEDEL